MSDAEKIIVVQFKNSRGGVVPGEMRQASNQASAEKIASAMAPRHVGVAAYAVTVDEESGTMANPRLLVSHGQIADLMPD
ncbi:hypothetical protein FY145_06835 [Agrobacterium tumefaciens]|uniref:Uncharacterized protein n=1 Tax=Agrobacterium tumefaciens TaxID=358 RepID=A0AAP9E378_AGRTU|nr:MULTISPECIES: hypothetical protein [Agrobacterium]MQB09497.1 hypothetical protein [Agrobacterium sp. ICMP 6402]NSZ57744.1 hypothetical protein [Agrobacterium tumefaciens]QDY93865.1 hypothetical protein CG010_006845 [Agrobacterium tumefaciens]UXS48935.1 hypothetical protein FY149_16950 [Agrobacterium tumefaciens]UXS70239.1 hypothetical protein FY146_06835 [Agrobacterium tumefaciens]